MAITATFAADFSSFQADVQKAEVSLKSFEQGAGKVETSLNRMTNGLSGTKLIQDATLAAEAVERIGGVSKLTEAELQRLSAQAKEASEKLRAMGQDVPAGIQKIADAGKQTTGVFSDLNKQVAATAAGFISAQAIIGGVQTGFRTLTGFVVDSIASYASAEAAAKKMTTALRAQGTATPEVIASFNDLASQFQRTTVYSDDLVNSAQALLTQIGGVAPGQMDKALKAATDLASGLGIDLLDATRMVAKASEENVGALKKAGVQLDETRVAGEGMSYILSEIEKKFGGQAQAAVDTYSGKVAQLANEWDNVKESVGKAIVEDQLVQDSLRAVNDSIVGVNDSASSGSKTITEWWASIASDKYVAAAIGFINDVKQSIQDLNREIAAQKPQSPIALPGDDGMIARVKTASDALIASTIKGWMQADDAAKKYASTLDAAFKKWSGADVAEQAKILDITFRRMADSGQITEQQLRAMAAEAAKLAEQGAILSPRLWDIVLATGELDPKLTSDAKAFAAMGAAVDLQIPKLSAFNAAVLDLTSKLGAADASLSAFVNAGIKLPALTLPKVPVGIYESLFGTPDQMGEYISTSILQAIQGGGDIANAAGSAIGQKIGSNVAKTLSKSLVDEGSGMFSKALGGLLSSALPVVGSLIGPLASKLWGALFGTAGRDKVKDFAASMGGFDALREELNALGAEGEKLWVKLTQGVGKNNPKEAQAAIDAVTAALERQKTKTEEAAAAAAKEAETQVKANEDALNAITERYAGTISKLESEYKSLNDAVSQEAEEAVMGVVETQQRERMKQIEAEKAAQEAMRDAEIAAKKLTFESWVKDGKVAYEELTDIFGKTLEIPYEFVPKGGGGDGGGRTYAPPPGGGGAASARVTVPVYLDGKVITTAVAKQLPTVLRQRGVVG